MVAKDQTDLSAGFDGAALGNAFQTEIFPTACVSRRRHLLETEDGEEDVSAEAMGAAARKPLGL
eukprot:1553303-Pyramimonas_sp.AAC.1